MGSMTSTELRRQMLQLPSEDRLQLALELWDSLGEDVPVPQWHWRVVRERLAELEGQNPEERSTPWEDVRRRVWPKTT